MAQTSPPNTNDTAVARRRPQIPPEDSIWVRYSPHYELPLSSMISFAVHAVGGILVALGIGAMFYFSDKDEPPPFGGMVDVDPGGGGGHPDGEGHARGTGNPVAGPRAEASDENKDQKPEPRTDKKVEFAPVTVARESFPELQNDPSADEVFASPTEALKSLEKVSTEARKKLMEGLTPGKGQGGPGRDGGKDRGVGTGEGPSVGPGKGGIMNQRVKRALRWTMLFNTRNGRDYRQQLADLSAHMREKTIIAMPRPGGDYLVFRNLAEEPPRGEVEDIASIKRIFWVDEKPESVASLAEALHIHQPPPYLVVFFPEELENKLLKLELNYGLQRGRHTEDQIRETQFQIMQRGGLYQPMVVNQR